MALMSFEKKKNVSLRFILYSFYEPFVFVLNVIFQICKDQTIERLGCAIAYI